MKRLIAVFMCLTIILTAAFTAGTEMKPGAEAAASGSLIAFPGAEGGGMYTTGARASSKPSVYHVTSLNNSGSGTLRDAVSKENRIIVFDVAGTINLTEGLTIYSNNLTILGQTAPGDGICVSGAPVKVRADNIIIRYMRFRMGVYDEDAGLYEDDALGGTYSNSNLIIDHCSMSWSTDECVSFYAIKDSTIQWCIMTEPLSYSIHEKGTHGYIGIWGGVNVSFHHNLMSSANSRFPRVGTSETVRSYNNTPDTESLLDIRNNVIYNWGGNNAYGGENGVRVNLVNNYYKEGPASSAINRFYEMYSGSNGGKSNWGTDLALAGNYYEKKNGSSADNINRNNKNGVSTRDSVIYNIEDYDESIAGTSTNHTQYIHDYPIGTHTAQEAFELVLDHAGASLNRDAVDERAVSNAKSGTAGLGNNGIIDLEHLKAMPAIVYSGVSAKDSDNDGMPDEYEDMAGLDKNNASDALQKAASGYFNLEEYANWLAEGNEIPIPPVPTPIPRYNINASEDITNGTIEINGISAGAVSWSAAEKQSEIGGAKTVSINENGGGTITMYDTSTTVFEFDGRISAKGETNPSVNPPFSSSNQPAGSVFMFKPSVQGEIKVSFYIYGGKKFNIYDNANKKYIQEQYTAPSEGYYEFSFDCEEGQEYYAWADGSKIGLESISVTGKALAAAGEVVSVITVPDSGYRTNAVHTIPETEIERVAENSFTFIMPGSDVIVGAEFVDSSLPTPSPSATQEPSGVFYISKPYLDGETIRAEIANYSDESGVWFITAVYKEGIVVEVKMLTIPMGQTMLADENNMRLSTDYTKDQEAEVKFFLWSFGTLAPY